MFGIIGGHHSFIPSILRVPKKIKINKVILFMVCSTTPSATSSSHSPWKRCNDMIQSWLLTTTYPSDIPNRVMYTTTITFKSSVKKGEMEGLINGLIHCKKHV
eukprot:TRINITY_DN19621_c2_g1_i1.p1 TRINITY_DN19621_c2_g1~~TRINITY_DN19621_c2_g1_i1.p1  ORF type:complete len:103 (-),score=2.48 TRINITY_DN19621_c2_g1_i1:54-362(-)